MFTFMLTEYIASVMSMHVFSMPKCLLCSCSRICFCNRQGKIMPLPFIATLSIITSSYLIGQYLSMPGSTTSLESGHPLIIYFHSICNLGFSSVTACMSAMGVHKGTSIDELMLCILTFLPGVSWSHFSMWLWHDSQSTMYSSGPV